MKEDLANATIGAGLMVILLAVAILTVTTWHPASAAGLAAILRSAQSHWGGLTILFIFFGCIGAMLGIVTNVVRK